MSAETRDTYFIAQQVLLSRLSLLHGFISSSLKGQHLLAPLNLQALSERKQGTGPMPLQPTLSVIGVFCHRWVMSSLLQHAGPGSQLCPTCTALKGPRNVLSQQDF